MFTLTSDRQRSHSQSFTDRYASQDYYLPPGSIPSRADVYPQGDIYSSSTRYTQSRESFSPPPNFNQSYDRRRSTPSSDFHDSPSVLYHAQDYVDSGRLDISNIFQMKRGDMPNALDNFSISNSHITFRDPTAVVTASSSEHSGDSDFWPNITSEVTQGHPPKPRKTRREKLRIELAPGQPPTTQGKPRARVYVACLQCRTRKIRCDGASPTCHNCGRRTNGNNECNYDPVPKRRGPDKTPGARQRMARDVRNEIDNNSSTRRRRRARDNSAYDAKQTTHQQLLTRQTSIPESPKSHRHVSSNSVFLSPSPGSPGAIHPTADILPVLDYLPSYSSCVCHGLTHCPGLLSVGAISDSRKHALTDQFDLATITPPYSVTFSGGYIADIDENGNERHNSNTPEIGSEPSLNFSRKIWWESLLSLYLSPTSTHLQTLTVSQRESAARGITSDLRFLFRTSEYWLSFFHIPSFFAAFFDPGRRERIQPSLVLALLAISTFWRSSELGYGNQGRERALRFRDEAQATLDASFNAGWIDETLAQAAWLLACFEICSHPRHTSQRSRSSIVMLDSIICGLSLTLVDADDPSACSPKTKTIWIPEQPLLCASPDAQNSAYDGHVAASPTHAHNGCNCHRFTLGESSPSSKEYAPNWSSTPAWDETWSEGDIRKESCRRLCWSSMILAAGHVSYTIAQRSQSLDLFIADPANYALLFSGESIACSPALSCYSSKDTIWALHDRCFLLWHSCVRMRNSKVATEPEKNQFVLKAWVEADNLEQALNRHACVVERAFIFHALEYLFNTRMYISCGFQRSIPLVSADVSGLFHRKKAEEWLRHQAAVAGHFMSGLQTTASNSDDLLVQRPFLAFCYMSQIHRALSLWECDNTLTIALEVCKAHIRGIDYLTALWPSAEQRYQYESLRDKVTSTCYNAGVEPPPVVDLSLSLFPP